MSGQQDDTKEVTAEPKPTVGRVIAGELISLMVMYALIAPAITAIGGGDPLDGAAAQKTLLLSAGGFVLQFAYMLGFRNTRRRVSMLGDYLMSFLASLGLVMSSYAFAVDQGRISEWLYWVLLAGVFSVTMAPVAVHDIIKSRKTKS
jgi:hypothetical protein